MKSTSHRSLSMHMEMVAADVRRRIPGLWESPTSASLPRRLPVHGVSIHALGSLLALLFFAALAESASAAQQDASAFFHKGAQHFLATNEAVQAKLAVTNGLKMFPNDEKLKKLWELLNQQQQQQQNKDDKSEQEEKKDQESKDQQKQGDDKKEQDKKSEEQKKQEQQKKEQEQDKKPEEEKKGQQAKPEQGKPEDQQEADGQPQAMRMTSQQAMQLLEALKAEEKAMPFRPVLKTNRQDRIFKDW